VQCEVALHQRPGRAAFFIWLLLLGDSCEDLSAMRSRFAPKTLQCCLFSCFCSAAPFVRIDGTPVARALMGAMPSPTKLSREISGHHRHDAALHMWSDC
jgi:hypothetical protein